MAGHQNPLISYRICSLAKALYHGKPIIAMPFFADQPYNAVRVVGKVSLLPLLASTGENNRVHKFELGHLMAEELFFFLVLSHHKDFLRHLVASSKSVDKRSLYQCRDLGCKYFLPRSLNPPFWRLFLRF